MEIRSMGISDHLMKAIEVLGYKELTEVQRDCIPKILNGESVKARSPTGTGKTAAFAIPIIELLSRNPYRTFAVVITPTRELALQINDQFQAFGAYMGIQTQCIVGGLSILKQSQMLIQGRPHIIIGTPGRLIGMLGQVDVQSLLRNLKFIVKDESDFLEESQGSELSELTGLLPKCTVLEFSATLSDAKVIGKRAELAEKMVLVPDSVKEYFLYALLKRFSEINIIVFAETCAEASLLALVFNELGLKVLPLHSLMSQFERGRNLEEFRSSKAAILLATDVASRGLDLPFVKLVINFNVPRSSKVYVHRVGRTARAGRFGTAITIVTQFECKLVLHIEKKLDTKMEELYDEEEFKALEDEVLDSMTKVTNVKALVSHVSFM